MNKLLIVLLFILINFYLMPDEDEYNGFFYIPTEEQINDYFNLYKYLNHWDELLKKLNEAKLFELYDGYVGQQSMQGLLFEAFLRQTKNKHIRKKIIEHINDNNLNDEFSQSLVRLYNSKTKTYIQDEQQKIQYNYNDKYYDENINLFKMKEVYFFNNELGMMLFDNDWGIIRFEDKDKKPTFFFIFGGGTNSMTIDFERYENITLEEFEKKVKGNKNNIDKFENWEIKDLPIEGVLKRAGADKIFLGFGYGDDFVSEIQCGRFVIYMYSSQFKRGYEVSYFMNFSGINNNFKLRKRIWNHLMQNLIFTFINTKVT